jgi:hypothetical protein
MPVFQCSQCPSCGQHHASFYTAQLGRAVSAHELQEYSTTTTTKFGLDWEIARIFET